MSNYPVCTTNKRMPGYLLLSLVTISPHCMHLLSVMVVWRNSTGHQLEKTELVFAKVFSQLTKFLMMTLSRLSIASLDNLLARVYDDEVRKWNGSTGIEQIGEKLLNSRDGPPTFKQPEMTIDKLLEYGNMLVQEQENVKRVQLADKYLKESALGDANTDSINNGSFFAS